jgi:hypothetical protein
MAISVGTGSVFLLLLGFQENYWEVSQAIFVGCMLLKVLYANVVYATEASPAVAVPAVALRLQAQSS